jgi:hypothetical protein
MKGIRVLQGDPADGVVELEYRLDEFPKLVCDADQLQNEVNAQGFHSFCCGVYIQPEEFTVRIAFTICQPVIKDIDEIVSKHVPHSVRLLYFEMKYPRHWWAIHNCGYNQNSIDHMLEEIRQDGTPPESTMNLLWSDADQKEKELRAGQQPTVLNLGQDSGTCSFSTQDGPPDKSRPANTGDLCIDATTGTMYIYDNDHDWVKVGMQSDGTESDPHPGFQAAIEQHLKEHPEDDDGSDLDGWDDSILDRESILP